MSNQHGRRVGEWRERLTPEQFAVGRRGATELPFSGIYRDGKEDEAYRCVCCGDDLFNSAALDRAR